MRPISVAAVAVLVALAGCASTAGPRGDAIELDHAGIRTGDLPAIGTRIARELADRGARLSRRVTVAPGLPIDATGEGIDVEALLGAILRGLQRDGRLRVVGDGPADGMIDVEVERDGAPPAASSHYRFRAEVHFEDESLRPIMVVVEVRTRGG